VYVPVLQIPWPTMSLVVKTAGSPEAAVRTVRETLRGMDPGLPVANVRTFDESMGRSVATERFSVELLGVFAAFAVLLAAFGIYGLQAYLTEQMRSEIGIRMALGARGGDVLRRVLGRGAVPVLVGLAIGIAVALSFSHLLRSQLYRVSPLDPWTYAAVAVLLGGVALLACYLPARSALRVEPGRLFSE
jgi:putative ABC transport system permease protein